MVPKKSHLNYYFLASSLVIVPLPPIHVEPSNAYIISMLLFPADGLYAKPSLWVPVYLYLCTFGQLTQEDDWHFQAHFVR